MELQLFVAKGKENSIPHGNYTALVGDDGCMDSGFNVLMLPLACWLEAYPSKSPSILPAIVDLYVICTTD